ncbi:MAG: phosphoglyceromutase [Flavobacteriales bacterium]|nr:MAG: phosphoglyceromutase [Flavobacteriales bacterium]PIE49342.1 MAG: phosphoglyceromutase [Flavobacteriales bacterium]
MNRFSAALLIYISAFFGLFAQEAKQPNVFLITLDGVRWQEVFQGIDTALVKNEKYTKDKKVLEEKFLGKSIQENRKKLMPFLWTTIAENGQIYGNKALGNVFKLTNTMLFSYPGYNEILTGYADDKNVNSNDKINNQNVTILEKANNDKKYAGKVAAFCSWDVFPYIINEKRSGVPVNAGYEKATGELTETEELLNQMQVQAPVIWNTVRPDVFTHQFAKAYLKKNKPKFLYIAYGETDDFAHSGSFDNYIRSLHNTDGLIADLWAYVQNHPFYKNNTYFIITTDHGRGKGVEKNHEWTSHGAGIVDAEYTWLAVIGPEVKPKGEMKTNNEHYANEIAATIAKIMGISLNEERAGKAIEPVFE